MSKASKKCVIGDRKLAKNDTLQAVVLADDFTTSLNPVQNVCPSIMMPVGNARLLDYLIETLIRSNVQELFLYCSSHVEMIKDYVSSISNEEMLVSLIISEGCRSLGDALRDIDTKGLIRTKFILIRGDAFTNANLNELMSLHQSKCERDKGAALTLLFRHFGSSGESLLREQSCILVADKLTKKVLFHKKLSRDDKKIKLELDWFFNHDQIQIHSSYVDTHIYMCSPSVLPLFADNFDFQTMEDFVKGVLMNEEILDSRIYWQALKLEDYALPITSWQAYHTLNRDILQRKGYPLTPDMLPLLRKINNMSRNTYKHCTAVLSRGCIVERDSIIGEKSTLGKNTLVLRSVIGGFCKIGENVRIENSHIFPGVTIRDNCLVDSCIVFTNCTLEENCQLDACILSPGVNLAGKSHHEDSLIHQGRGKKVNVVKMSELETETSDEFFYYKNKDVAEVFTESDESCTENSSLRASPLPDDTNMFLSEVIDSLLRGYQDKLNCDNLILEINSSRYAYNVNIREVTYNVIRAILALPLHYLAEQKSTINDTNYHKILRVIITYFNPIILNYVKTEDAQEDCLRAIQDVASTTHELLSFVKLLLHTLYDRDILSEEKILQWFETIDDDDDYQINAAVIKTAVAPFITWLREAEEDSSDDD